MEIEVNEKLEEEISKEQEFIQEENRGSMKKGISLHGISLDWTTTFQQSVPTRQIIVDFANM